MSSRVIGTQRFLTELGEAGSSYGADDKFLTLSTCADGTDQNARTVVAVRTDG